MLKKLNSNNKGFSLAELLVAVTILGISVGMVLHAFSTSANITARSRAFGEATMAADNIAEAVNAYTRDSFMQGSGAEMLGITADDDYKADDRQVAVKGIQAGNSTYDAVITYSEGEPLLDGEAVGGDEAGIYELNNYEIAQYTAMDGSFTQSWQADQNPDAKSDIEFYREAVHPAAKKTLADDSEVPAYKAKNRIISVNVYTDTSDRIYMDVVYNYTYTYEQYVYVEGVQQYKTQNGVQVPETQNAQFLYTWSSRVTFNQDDPTCYSTTAEGANAEPTVFIMYYPYYRDNTARTGPFYGQAYPRYAQYDINPDKTNMTDSYKNLEAASVQRNYNTDGGLKTRDLIIINNLGNVPTKFFIVKQRMVQGGAPVTDEFLTTSNLYEHPSSQSCIIQRITDASLLLNKEANKIYTNAGISLATQRPLGQAAFTGYKWVNNSGITINGNYLNTLNEKDFMKKDLVTMEKDNRYYLISIDVYRSGTVETEEIAAADPNDETLYTISTTSSPVYTFNGSKLD